MLNAKRVLILGAHTDDAELGVGGTISRLTHDPSIEAVHVVYFSACEERVPEGFAKDKLRFESRNALDVLAVKPENQDGLHFKVDHFMSERQAILHAMWCLRVELNPDLVITHCSYDHHCDHQVIHQEAVRAFKGVTLLGYEFPWNSSGHGHAQGRLAVSRKDMERKMRALECYVTQRGRPYFDPEYILAWARTCAINIAAPFAEAVEVISCHI